MTKFEELQMSFKPGCEAYHKGRAPYQHLLDGLESGLFDIEALVSSTGPLYSSKWVRQNTVHFTDFPNRYRLVPRMVDISVADLRALRADLAAANAKAAELYQELTTLRQSIAVRDTEIARLETDLELAKRRIAQLKTEVADIGRRTGELQGELLAAKFRERELKTKRDAFEADARRVVGLLSRARGYVEEIAAQVEYTAPHKAVSDYELLAAIDAELAKEVKS